MAGLEATTPSLDHLTTSSGLLLTPGPDSSHPSGPPALSSAKLRSCVLKMTRPRLKPLPLPFSELFPLLCGSAVYLGANWKR